MTQTSTNYKRSAPQRTCVACSQVKDKRELIRLVRLGDGRVVIDVYGRMEGRGAYLCPTLKCWQAGLSGSRLDYVLKASIEPVERERLLAEGRSLIGGG
jgi:predicted RNA-binding protein YlxR (DUF448 family)